MPPDLRFAYRPSAWRMYLAALFFLAFTGLSTLQAYGWLERRRGISSSWAPLLYWTGVALFALMAMTSLFQLFRGLTSKAEIVLTHEQLVVPRMLFRSAGRAVPFAEIQRLSTYRMRWDGGVQIDLRKGELNLLVSYFSDEENFTRFINALENRMRPSCTG